MIKFQYKIMNCELGGNILKIEKQKSGTELTLILKGRLDTNTSKELEVTLRQAIDGIEKLIFDFTELEYLSSAGLRVLLTAQKVMTRQKGDMIIHNINDVVKEVFEVTGFDDIFCVE